MPGSFRCSSLRYLLVATMWLGAWTVEGQQTRTVSVGNNFFRDSVSNNSTSTINAGDTIHWVWVGGFHSTTSGCGGDTCTPDGLWDSGTGTGISFNRTFNTPGTFPYYCTVHGVSMRGTIVVQATAVATATALATSGSPSAVGESVTFTATVTSSGGTPTGTVQFKDGGNDLGSPATLNGQGVATLTTSALTAGTHTITAAYAGNASFNPSTSPGLSQVVKNNTTTTLQASPNPSTSGQAVTFNATVTNAGVVATGTVSFRDGEVEIGSGVLNGTGTATFQTSTLAVGSHPMTAVFGGSSLHFGSTSEVLQQVVAAPTTPTFAPSSLDFGGVVLRRASPTKVVTLTNHSAVPLSMSGLQVTGDYSQTNDCGPTLAASGSCTVHVVFTPQAMGTRTGQLTLSGANTVTLTGNGVEFTLPLARPPRPPRS